MPGRFPLPLHDSRGLANRFLQSALASPPLPFPHHRYAGGSIEYICEWWASVGMMPSTCMPLCKNSVYMLMGATYSPYAFQQYALMCDSGMPDPTLAPKIHVDAPPPQQLPNLLLELGSSSAGARAGLPAHLPPTDLVPPGWVAGKTDFSSMRFLARHQRRKQLQRGQRRQLSPAAA